MSAPFAHRIRRYAAVPLVVAAVLSTTACSTLTGLLPGGSTAVVTPAPTPLPLQVATGRFGQKLDVDPDSSAIWGVKNNAKTTTAADAALLKKITAQPLTGWYGDWDKNVTADVARQVDGAYMRGTIAVVASYNMPDQGCTSASETSSNGQGNGVVSASTGAATYGKNTPQTVAQHKAWVGSFLQGLGSHRAIVIVEADALADMKCLTKAQKTSRLALLKWEVGQVVAQGSFAYIDAGHPAWNSVAVTAKRLKAAGISNATGFVLNDANTWSTEAAIKYGTAISKKVGGAHFIVDTSRNGRPRKDSAWCNPTDVGLGTAPTTSTASTLVDAYLWVKIPGTSDGECNSGLAAGKWMQSYALMLAQNASF